MWSRHCRSRPRVLRPHDVLRPGGRPLFGGGLSFRDRHRPFRKPGATVAELARIMLKRTRGDWMKILDEGGIPYSTVHTLGELASHPHTIASDVIQSYRNDGRTVNCVASPLRVDGLRPGTRRALPRHGQDTRAIHAECGYSDEAVASMIAAGVILLGRQA